MSSPFPYIRLKGDKEAAGQHLRRAMGELFKTERIAELAGVPILKRSIPVNDHTMITVQISKEQKFVWVESNPPSGEEYVEEEEEKRFSVDQCPPGFIVRKLTYDERFPTGSLNQTKYKGDGSFDGYPGHIIAYDGKQWRSARFDEANLGVFEGASNCGWWHLADVIENGGLAEDDYNACDIITWEGGHGGLNNTTQSHSGPASSGVEDIQKVGARPYLKDHFFHGGKKIDGPSGYVLCACIVKENNVDYYYCCSVLLSNVWHPSLSGIAYYTVTAGNIWVSRKRVSDTGGWESWEVQHIIKPQDPATNDSPWVREGYVPGDGEWNLPWGTGYCDAEGNAYVPQIYYSQIPVTWPIAEYPNYSEATRSLRIVKIDLRSGKTETVGDSAPGVIKQKWTAGTLEYWGGPWNFNAPPSTPTAKTAGIDAVGSSDIWQEEPALIGMWGGGQDLYTYWIEPWERFIVRNGYHISVPAERYEHHYINTSGDPAVSYQYTREDTVTLTQSASCTIVLSCYKMKDGDLRATLVDSINLWEYENNANVTHEYVDAAHDYKRNIQSGGWDGPWSDNIVCRHIFDHNPEIKNSWEYSQIAADMDGVSRTAVKTMSYHRDGKTLRTDSATITQALIGPVLGGIADQRHIGPGWSVEDDVNGGGDYSPAGWAKVLWKRYTVLDAASASGSTLDTGVRAYAPTSYSPLSGTWDGHRVAAQSVVPAGSGKNNWVLGYFKMGDFSTTDGDYRFAPGWGWMAMYQTNLPGSWPNYHGSGNGTRMIIAQHSINLASDNRSLYAPPQFAVHREIKGMDEKPYIRVRRPVYRHPSGMADLDGVPGGAAYYYAPDVNLGWDKVFESYRASGPAGEEGNWISSTFQQNYRFGVPGNYDHWRWWCRAAGNAEDGYEWDEWEIDCNFASKEQINKLVGYDPEVDKGSENMFFEIAVL